ncbi:MAG TPA: energy-coupling factor transporter ATPase [Clostridia bacterium]|nr:energy-coupling factor transporter ATPase [Clostridia bacterium]
MSIRLKDVSYTYNADSLYETTALDQITFEVGPGESLGIIGHTGSGKSTLLQLLNGLLRPDSGYLEVAGIEISKSKKNLSALRKEVGLVFQYPEYQLFEETVARDIAFGPKNQGLSDEEVEKRVKESMELIGLDESYRDKSPLELSGGEKRRAAIAGVLAMRPRILMLDEPTAGLDPQGRAQLIKQLMVLKGKLTLVFISHSMEEVAKIADRILVLSKGKLILDDSVDKVFEEEKLLKEVGLDLPVIARLFARLREEGCPYKKNYFLLEDGLRVLMEGEDD